MDYNHCDHGSYTTQTEGEASPGAAPASIYIPALFLHVGSGGLDERIVDRNALLAPFSVVVERFAPLATSLMLIWHGIAYYRT